MLIYIDGGHGRCTEGKWCLKQLNPAEAREWILNPRISDKLQAVLN